MSKGSVNNMVTQDDAADMHDIDEHIFSIPENKTRTGFTQYLTIPRLFVIVIDMVSALLTVWLAFSLRLEVWHWPAGSQRFIYLLAPILMLPVFIYFGLYRAIYRYSGFAAFVTVVKAVVVYGLLFMSAVSYLNYPMVPRTVGILQPMMFLLMVGGTRGLIRFWYIIVNAENKNKTLQEKLLIYSAGSAGVAIVNAITQYSKFELVGFIDDNPKLQGLTINGMKVYSLKQAIELTKKQGIKNILLAMPSASRLRLNQLVDILQQYPVRIQMLPALGELIDGRVGISDIKEIQIEDLLGRDPVTVNEALVTEILTGRVVMVTGAGGSVGSELCRQILAAKPSKLLLIDNAEYNLFVVHNDLEYRRSRLNLTTGVIPLLGDVTDESRMAEICRVFNPSVIYHAAAYKHVPMVEQNPVQGVRNNVLGTLTIAEVALQYKISSVVLVSTDKAVRPTNVMGASKRFCEMIFQALADQQDHTTCFSMVRFGNVLGSSGSVVPLFRRQIKEGGPLTITHKDITRYFMTISEAAQLIIQAGAMASGGDVYLIDMGEPVKIIDLAQRMVKLSGLSMSDIEISITGLRPGEKLFEELLIGTNSEPTTNPRIFKANEQFIPWSTLLEGLGELRVAISNNDFECIKDLLIRLVPEYLPSSITADFLAIEQKNHLMTV